MDNETVDKKLGGIISKIGVRVSRKRGDGNFGSYGEEYWVEMDLPPDADFKKEVRELEGMLFTELKLGMQALESAVLGQETELRNTEKPTTIKDAPPEVDDFVPPSPDDFVEEQVNIPIDDKGQEKIIFPVETIEIYAMKSGDKAAKIRGKVANAGSNIAYGGNYTKFGVQAWEEALALPPLEWAIAEMDIATYPAPPGLTAVCLTKENEKGELIPTKVEEWK